MNCLKCGREITEGNVFCPDCLAVMEKYPVKPNASVQLPRRDEQEAPKKSSKRKKISQEERIAKLKKQSRRMALVIAILFVLLCVLAGRIAHQELNRPGEKDEGKNYTTQETQ